VESIPAMIVIDKTGKVAYTTVGFSPGTELILAQHLGIPNYTPSFGGKQ
jgi:hypothetical protein